MRIQIVLALVLFAMANVSAEEKVTVSGVHLCCKSCVDAIEAAGKTSGATVTGDKETKTVVVVAKDKKEAQAALDAISAAGYYGTSDSKEIVMKPAAVGDGKSTGLEVTTHNCCAKCTKAIVADASSTAGVTGTEATPKDPKIKIQGSFETSAAVKSLNDGGFQLNKP